MPTSLKDVATAAQDLFYQDYAPRDAFFDEWDFKFHAASYYNDALNKLYQQERHMNKSEDGFSNIEIPAAWLIEEVLDICYDETYNRHYAKTSSNIYSFDYDGSANALQGVHSKGPHIVYRKISLNERRFKQILPTINKVLFYLNSPNEIVFWNAREKSQVIVQYVPEIKAEDDNCLLSDNIVADVIRNTLTIMFGAKQGNVVQEVNDGNKNLLMQQQINPNTTKAQQ